MLSRVRSVYLSGSDIHSSLARFSSYSTLAAAWANSQIAAFLFYGPIKVVPAFMHGAREGSLYSKPLDSGALYLWNNEQRRPRCFRDCHLHGNTTRGYYGPVFTCCSS